MNVVMPFGKHRGMPMRELELEYLEWVASCAWPDATDDLSAWVRKNHPQTTVAAALEIERRKTRLCAECKAPIGKLAADTRTLCKKCI